MGGCPGGLSEVPFRLVRARTLGPNVQVQAPAHSWTRYCHCPVFYRIVHLTQKLSPKYDHAYKELEPNRWPLLFHDEETTKQHFKHVSLVEESDLV